MSSKKKHSIELRAWVGLLPHSESPELDRSAFHLKVWMGITYKAL
jgi:hypothetical protein